MRAILIRLRDGGRWWMAELVLRGAGLGLLFLFTLSMRWCCRLVDAPPQHQATPVEFIAAAMVFAFLAAGLALLFEGPGLFRPIPLPPRAMFA